MGDDLPPKHVIVEDVVAMTRRKYERLIARVAELERQRDKVMALCDRPIEPWEHAEERLGDIRKIYGGGE